MIDRTKYAVVTFKATRGFQLVVDEITFLEAAIREANRFYEIQQILEKHKLTVSGISTMLVKQDDLELVLSNKCPIPFNHLIKYQAGGY